jgi:flagellar basal body-associated protein FliL
MDQRNDQRKGERHKAVIIFTVIAVILVGIFLIILFFFHTDLRSRGSFRPAEILASQRCDAAGARPPAHFPQKSENRLEAAGYGVKLLVLDAYAEDNRREQA